MSDIVDLAVVAYRINDSATSMYIAAQPLKNELNPSIIQTNGMHKRRQRRHCATTDGTLMIMTHKDEANIPITRPISRRDKRGVLLLVAKQWVLTAKDASEIINNDKPTNRENRHSLIVARRTEVKSDEFWTEYKHSTGIDTEFKWNKCRRLDHHLRKDDLRSFMVLNVELQLSENE